MWRGDRKVAKMSYTTGSKGTGSKHESDVGSYFMSLVSLPAQPQISDQWATLEVQHHSWGRILKGGMTVPQWRKGWWRDGQMDKWAEAMLSSEEYKIGGPQKQEPTRMVWLWIYLYSDCKVTSEAQETCSFPISCLEARGAPISLPILPHLPTLSRTSAPTLPPCIYFMLPSVLISKQSPILSNLHNLNKSVPSTHLKSCGTQLWRNLCLRWKF